MKHSTALSQFITQLEVLTPTNATLLTIGKFDGVHRAHQHLIRGLVERARNVEADSAVLTFDPHPDEVLRPERNVRSLTTIHERAELIANLGVDRMIVLPFTKELSQLSPYAFMELLTKHIQLKELWVGPDFRLGYKAQGTLEILAEIGQKLGYSIQPIDVWTLDGEPVRSTSIRDLITQGNVTEACRYLGRPFSLEGQVIYGDQRGRTIGFPTANIAIPIHHVVPANGVYACHVILDDGRQLNAVTNIGVRPTFGALQRNIETHIFNLSEDLYTHTIHINFLHHLRSEQRFDSVEALVHQIHIDAAQAQAILQ